MNPFQNPFQEYAGNQTRISREPFLPRYARGRRQETGDRRQVCKSPMHSNSLPRAPGARCPTTTTAAAMQSAMP